MGKIGKRKYDAKRKHIREIIKYNSKINRKFTKSFLNKKSEIIFNKMFENSKKHKSKFKKMINGEYVPLNIKEHKLLRDKNFLNSQNYITSSVMKFKLFYFSKEEIKNYNESKIIINKIRKDLFEKFYINFFKFIWINKNINGYKVYLGKKYLYLIKI